MPAELNEWLPEPQRSNAFKVVSVRTFRQPPETDSSRWMLEARSNPVQAMKPMQVVRVKRCRLVLVMTTVRELIHIRSRFRGTHRFSGLREVPAGMNIRRSRLQ